MAEQVQAALDQMVEPLRDLMDRHILTEEEIRAIVNRRRESEYLLRRRAARKADFVRYIEAEMLLEKLRGLRTSIRKKDHRRAQREKGLGDDENENENETENKSKDGKKQDHIGDAHIVQHIHLLFVRAIRKFRGDLSLHLQHAEFCKTVKSWTRLSRVYAEALQVFPREAGIWIEAASNEFFGPNRSVKSARVLLQRALRLNGETSEDLWVQYFTLELHYAQTLRGRRTILNPVGGSNDGDNDNDNNDNDDDGTDYNKIARIVLRNAIRSIPGSVRFRLKFLDACREFPGTSDLMEFVRDSMARDFAEEPESWIARAVYRAEQERSNADGTSEPTAKRARKTGEASPAGDAAASDPVLAVLREATETLGTDEMLLQAFRFSGDYRMELEHSGTAGEDSLEEVDRFVDGIWKKAREKRSYKASSAELAMEETRYLLERGREKEALRTIRTYCTETKPSARSENRVGAAAPVEAWLLWASLSSDSFRTQTSILERALGRIPMDEHPDYVVALLQFLGASLETAGVGSASEDGSDSDSDSENDSEQWENQASALFGTLQKLLLLSPKTKGDAIVEPGSTGLDFEVTDVFSACRLCLDRFYDRSGIKGARKIYEAVLFRSNAALSLGAEHAEPVKGFVDRCLALEEGEKEAATAKKESANTSAKQRAFLRRLYDKAIEVFAGTPLEDSYREDRNERAIFA